MFSFLIFSAFMRNMFVQDPFLNELFVPECFGFKYFCSIRDEMPFNPMAATMKLTARFEQIYDVPSEPLLDMSQGQWEAWFRSIKAGKALKSSQDASQRSLSLDSFLQSTTSSNDRDSKFSSKHRSFITKGSIKRKEVNKELLFTL